jgi:hypothetical protein
VICIRKGVAYLCRQPNRTYQCTRTISFRASLVQRIIGRRTVGPPAARLPTAQSGVQRIHGTASKGPGPAKEAPVAGKYTLSLAPATKVSSKSQPATMATTMASKAKKVKNFSSEEERQLCRSFLHVSQDPIAGNGQRAGPFWDRIARHYQEHKPQGREDRPARSLETKWGGDKTRCCEICCRAFAGVEFEGEWHIAKGRSATSAGAVSCETP